MNADMWLVMVGTACGVVIWFIETQIRRVRSRNDGREQ